LRAGDVLTLGNTEIAVLAVPAADQSLMPTRARGTLRFARVEAPPARYTVELRQPGLPARRLTISAVTDLGRENVAVVVNDTLVSRRHLRLTPGAEGLVATDLGSRNGSLLNGNRLTGPTRLRAGDELRLGNATITLLPGDAGPAKPSDLAATPRPKAAVTAPGLTSPPPPPPPPGPPPQPAPPTISLPQAASSAPTPAAPAPVVPAPTGSAPAAPVVPSDPTTTADPATPPDPAAPPDPATPPAPTLTPPSLAPPAPAPTVAPPPPAPTLAPPARPGPAVGFPSYLELPTRVPVPVWRVIQIISMASFFVLCGTLFLAPEAGLFTFWNVVVPLLPALFFLAPGVWRNVCPLAATNQVSRLAGITRGRQAPAWLRNYGYLISAAAFVAIVTSRKVLFNSSATALAVLLLAVIGLAFTGGLLFKGKSGWCSSVCPLLPVQRLYGQTPFVVVPNSHCRPCVGCTKNCYDFNPRVAYQADLQDDDPGWSAPRKLFAGSFPGLVAGYFTIPAPPAITVAEMYLRFAVFLLASAGSFFVLDAVLRKRSALLAAAYGVTALILFYGYQAPTLAEPIERSIERLTGAEASWLAWLIRIGVLALGVVWLGRTFRTERSLLAQSAPAVGPVSLGTPQLRTAAHVGGQPEVHFTPLDHRVVTTPGRTLLEIAEADGLPLEAGCRMGVCGADPIAVLEGTANLSPLEESEARTLARLGYAPNTRLACCARVQGNVTVSLTPDQEPGPAAGRPAAQPAGDVDTSIRKVVVIGHGIAGVTAADLVRRRHPDCQLDVVGQEAHALYNRMAISRLIYGRSAMQGLYLQPETWYEQRRISSWLNTRARSLEVAAGHVLLATGDRLDYDRLILASGSAAAVPVIDGFGRPGTFVLREAGDAIAVRAFAQRHDARRAVVAGGGLLGLEVAYSLHQLGLAVTVLERSDRLLHRQVDVTCSALLERYVEELGIQVVTQAEAAGVSGAERAEVVTLKDGRGLPADLLVVCAGIRPAIDLARAAGIDVGLGVLVDDRMRTSAPGVYAAGDVAEFEGRVPGLWPIAVDQALVAAINATGGDERYRSAAPAMILKGVGLDLTVAGAALGGPDDEVITCPGPARYMYARLVVRSGRLIGGLVLDRAADAPALVAAVRDRRPVEECLDALRAGDLSALAADRSPAAPAAPGSVSAR
jgi:nitrite reductase (NADH) large subunit